MGGIITPSKEEEIKKFLRLDDSKKLKEFLIDNQITPEALYTNSKRTLLQLCCYYESPKCLSKLIEMNYDYNQAEENGNTPLFISCKFNSLSLVMILLSKEDCKKLVKNNEGLNEFDIAFLKGNYHICYYLLYGYKNGKDKKNIDIDSEDISININIKKESSNNSGYDINQVYQKYFFNNNFDIDYFMSLQEENKYPLFNMSLFFKSLCQKIPPDKCESFAPERKKTKDLQNKIPDPNETWGHFFKRVVNMELYNPPLVDKRNVSQMNSLYMNAQMKLIENEYGVKLSYYNPNNNNENNNYDEDDEQQPIIKIKKRKNKDSKIKDNKKLDNNIEKDKNEENNNIENNKEDNKNEDNINKDIKNEDNKNEDNIINDEKDVKSEDLCILKIKDYSSDRNINDEIKNDE